MNAVKTLLLSTLMLSASAHAASQGALKILFVGYEPSKVVVTDGDRLSKNPERAAQLRRERTPAFENLLKQNFKTVKVVYADDYKQSMSADYDVTIFDAAPHKIKNEVLEKDASGKPIGFHPAEYLTPDFSDAALLISTTAPSIGEPLQYKMDWLCECLGAQAHGVKFDHPIFNTPTKVKLTIQYQDTPANYAEYYSGRDLPKSLPMWRVQAEGYEDEKGMPPGLVSSGPGYTEGTDAEIISNGANQKSSKSVALSRHANFFHWGFSASPAQMTDEAKQVFINSVYYIAQFKGERPYSHRPYRSAFNNRHLSLDCASRLSTQSYEDWVKQQEAAQKTLADVYKNLETSGVKLTDEQRKQMAAPAPKLPSKEEWLKTVALQQQPASVTARFGNKLDQYLPFYEDNFPYLVQGKVPYTFEVDEDVRSLGVANSDPQLMQLCVAMLESNLDTDKAKRILARYSGEKFATTAEWRKWIDANRGRLYFSDEDGYRFHVRPVAADAKSTAALKAS